jgi:hypothetical protein
VNPKLTVDRNGVAKLVDNPTNWAVGLAVTVVALALIIWALMKSKRDSPEMEEAYREGQ